MAQVSDAHIPMAPKTPIWAQRSKTTALYPNVFTIWDCNIFFRHKIFSLFSLVLSTVSNNRFFYSNPFYLCLSLIVSIFVALVLLFFLSLRTAMSSCSQIALNLSSNLPSRSLSWLWKRQASPDHDFALWCIHCTHAVSFHSKTQYLMWLCDTGYNWIYFYNSFVKKNP